VTNKNQVQTPSSEGEDFDGRFREGSSLALGSPDYRRQVLSDPRAHGYTVESDEKWAAFVSDKCQPLTPEEEAQHRVGWDDATMSAKTWFAMGDVRPADAAMLLCRFNPKKTKMKDAKQRTTDEPCDLALLVECLKDLGRTAPRFRTLLDWLDAAKQKNFPHHSWIDQYVAAAALLNPAPPPELAALTPAPPSEAATIEPAPAAAHEWEELARIEARRIRKAAEAKGWFPNLKTLGDEVAKVFNQKEYVGPNGHAMRGAHITRNALQGHGITKHTDKLRSTMRQRGK